MHPYQITSQIAADHQAGLRADAANQRRARPAPDARPARRAAAASEVTQPMRPVRRWRLAFLQRATL